MVFQNKSVAWKFLRGHRGAAKNSREYYRGRVVSLSTLKGVPGWCGLCWGFTIGTPTSKGASVEAGFLRMARVFQEWPWVIREWL